MRKVALLVLASFAGLVLVELVLACHPATTTHSEMTPKQLDRAGVTQRLVRISVGIENWRDLLQEYTGPSTPSEAHRIPQLDARDRRCSLCGFSRLAALRSARECRSSAFPLPARRTKSRFSSGATLAT
jgi:hypothetical protein